MSGFEFDPIGDVPPDREEYERWQRDQMQNLIERSWENYMRKVLPAGASTVQRWESRRAYYAGASTLFSILVSGMGPGDEPQPEDLELMRSIKSELDNFAAAVKDGRA